MIAKLCRVQAALKAPKNQRNNFGNYNYRSCEDILEAVKPLLAQEGLVLTITDGIEMVGNRYYVKATATVTDGEKSISATAYAREADSRKGMDEAQVTGSSSSYSRKYALNGLFCIDDTRDADTMDNRTSTPEPKAKTKAAPKQKDEPILDSGEKKKAMLKQIAEGAKKHSISADDMKLIMKRQYNKESSTKLTEAEVADLAANFERYAIEMVEDEAKMMEDIPL